MKKEPTKRAKTDCTFTFQMPIALRKKIKAEADKLGHKEGPFIRWWLCEHFKEGPTDVTRQSTESTESTESTTSDSQKQN